MPPSMRRFIGVTRLGAKVRKELHFQLERCALRPTCSPVVTNKGLLRTVLSQSSVRHMELAPPKGTQMHVRWDIVERISIDCPASELRTAKAWAKKLGFVVTSSNPTAAKPPFTHYEVVAERIKNCLETR
jgi:hypothetical protein